MWQLPWLEQRFSPTYPSRLATERRVDQDHARPPVAADAAVGGSAVAGGNYEREAGLKARGSRMNDLSIRPMRPEDIAIAIDWAAAEGWNPGLADATCFATPDPHGFLIAE